MSDTYTNPAPLEAEEDIFALDEQETISEPEIQEGKSKNVGTRIFAAILAAISVAMFFLPIQVLKGYAAKELSLLNALTDLFGTGSTGKLFGILPSFGVPTEAGIVFYAFVALIVLAFLFSLIAVLSGKSSLLYAATYCLMLGCGAYATCTYTVTAYKGSGAVIDKLCLLVAAASAFVYLVLSFCKAGKRVWANLCRCSLRWHSPS